MARIPLVPDVPAAKPPKTGIKSDSRTVLPWDADLPLFYKLKWFGTVFVLSPWTGLFSFAEQGIIECSPPIEIRR